MVSETFPWLGFPAAIDLANTVIVGPTGERELLDDHDRLDEWIAAERGRIPDVDAASGRLEQVRELRDSVRQLLRAAARGEPPPEPGRARINAISASAPIRITLTADGDAAEEADVPAGFRRFEATIARSVIEVVDRGEDELSICEAPSCGMLFVPQHPRQVWCSHACGNRARVARHAARHVGRRPEP